MRNLKSKYQRDVSKETVMIADMLIGVTRIHMAGCIAVEAMEGIISQVTETAASILRNNLLFFMEKGCAYGK